MSIGGSQVSEPNRRAMFGVLPEASETLDGMVGRGYLLRREGRVSLATGTRAGSGAGNETLTAERRIGRMIITGRSTREVHHRTSNHKTTFLTAHWEERGEGGWRTKSAPRIVDDDGTGDGCLWDRAGAVDDGVMEGGRAD